MTNFSKFWNFEAFLLLLGLLNFFFMNNGDWAFLLVVSLVSIGVPYFIAAAFLPFALIFLLLARSAYWALKLAGIQNKLLIVIISIGLLAAIPFAANFKLDTIANSLIADDKNDLKNPPAFNTLAIVQPKGYHYKGICDDLCQRLLLKGSVARVVMARAKFPMDRVTEDIEGRIYWIEKRVPCPNIELREGVGNLKIAGEDRSFRRNSPAKLLNLLMARGSCVLQQDSSVAEADALLVMGSVHTGTRAFRAGLNPFVDTLGASRLSFFLRTDGRWVESYRSTVVTYQKLFPLLMPSFMFGKDFRMTTTFVRQPAFKGTTRRFQRIPALEHFLKNVLGLDLSVSDEDAGRRSRDIIVSALDHEGAIDTPTLTVIDDFIEGKFVGKDFVAEDGALVARILADKRVPVPGFAWKAIKRFSANDGNLADRFAKVLFDRLFDGKPEENQDDANNKGYSLSYLGNAIGALPDRSIRPYRQQLERLAHDDARRVRGYEALKKLSVFGARVVTLLLYLIDDADRVSKSKKARKVVRDNDWQHPYLAGLIGLCRMGQEGRSAIPALYERLESGVIIKHGSLWRLTINTLVSLGADPDEMWSYLQTEDENRTRERFDREVARAIRRLECAY